jgi:hypothetical protein
MAIRLVQNLSTHNNKKRIHNFFLNVPREKRWHFANTSNSIFFSIVTNDNNILKLQSLLEHNDFAYRPKKHLIMLC